ncbi:MAG: hypothetical protein K2P70_13565 [Hyphomonadaceae bacterium]|nr:hypothetical protein [Hyphomonadaceae bacterium]
MRAFLVFVLLLAACASPAPPARPAPTPAPQPAPVVRTELGRLIQADMARLDRELAAPGVVVSEIGATADLGDGLTVRPIAIIEDSRCPQNAQCLWEGRMRIRASVSGQDAELRLGETFETSRGAVEFVIASPGPWAEWPRDELGPRPPYRFGFRRAD